MLLSVLVLLFFNLIKGVNVNDFHRKILAVLIVWDVTFLVINEKATIRENWRWWMIVLMSAIVGLFSCIIFL